MKDEFEVLPSTLSRQSSTVNPPILFVFLEVFEREGGIQSFAQSLLQSYSALADVPLADVWVLRDRGEKFPASKMLRFRGFKRRWRWWGRVCLAIALLHHLWRARPRRVICGHLKLALLVGLGCRLLGISYAVVIYGKEAWSSLPAWERWALRRASRVLVNSRYTGDRVCRMHRLSPERLRLLVCVVDGDRFTPGPPLPHLVERYQLQDACVLLTVARLWSGDRYKGVDVTIRALAAIAQAFPTVKYLVVGRGDDQLRLAALAEELGVGDRVVFAGFVPTELLVEHYRLADIYVMPSQEGFGVVYLEAMACGVPVLAGDGDGSAEPLQDGRLGWRVHHRDSVAVAHACIEMLKGRHRSQQTSMEHEPSDPRCDGEWLRQETLQWFSPAILTGQLHRLLLEEWD